MEMQLQKDWSLFGKIQSVDHLNRCFTFHSLPLNGLSQWELHLAHAEIRALQATFGISYKDAAHRLFMSEVERLKKADVASKACAEVRERMDHLAMEDIFPAINTVISTTIN